MKHYLLLCIVIILTISQGCKTTKSVSQSGYLFETEIQSNTILKTYTEQVMDLTMTMSGPGMPSAPTSVTTKTIGGTTMTIGAKNNTGLNPVLVAYDSLTITTSEQSAPEMPDFSNGKIHGHYDGNTITIDSITGLNDQLGNMIQQFSQPMFENLKINFPKTPMNIGDSFRDYKTMDLPMQGVGTGTMNFNSEYVLEKVMDGVATFNTKVEISGSIVVTGEEFPITGKGNGKSVLDIAEKYMTYVDMNLTQNISMNIQGMSMSNVSVIQSKNEITKTRVE